MFYAILILSLTLRLQPGVYTVNAENCQVELKSLQGTYEGDCKKGLAHGIGKAVGEDTYEGEFRKGLPNGQGTYTWANGDSYTGTWKKGMKEGEGVWYIKKEDTTLKGYWKDDEYIGTEKDPYKIISKSISVNRVTFQRLTSEPDEIEFTFSRLGKPAKVRDFRISDNFGVVTRGTDYAQIVEVYNFPLQGTINFAAEQSRAAAGSGVEYEPGELNFQINQAGKWMVTIEIGGSSNQ